MITVNIHKKNERKLNSSIFENKEHKNKISSFWQKWQQRKQNYQDPTIWWDNGKKFVQGLTKDFCTELKETEKNHLHQLHLELQTLQYKKQRSN